MNRNIMNFFVFVLILILAGFNYCYASPLENDVELGWPRGEYYVHFGSDPVNLKNGNLYYPNADLFIPCVGFPLSVTRSYNSRSRYTGIFGFGWSSNLDIRLEIEQYKVVMMEADGFRETFTFFQQKGDVRRFRSPGKGKTVEIQNKIVTVMNRQTGEKRIFDDKGKILQRVDKYGNKLTYQYNDQGHLFQVVDPAGRTIEILTDPIGKVIQITDPIQRVIRYEYDTKDNLICVTDRAGHKTRFSYDKLHNLLRIDYPNGGSTKFSYNLRRDLIIKELGPERRSTSYRYKLDPKHPESWTVEVIDALKNITRYDYSNNGYHLVITDAMGGKTIKESCGECGGRLMSITDARGNTTRYQYTSKDAFNITTRINALDHRTIAWYNHESGDLVREVAPNGAVTQYRYDQLGNLIEEVDALDNSSKYEYDNRGLRNRLIDSRGGVTKLSYDGHGNLISIIDPMGNASRFVYDSAGRLIQVIDPLNRVSKLFYSPDDLVVMAEDPMGYQVYAEYNKSGQPVRIWDEKSTLNRFSYNHAGDLIEITNALNNKQKFEYDPLGRLVSYTNTRGFTWSSRYDALGREIEIINPLGFKETRRYDLVGNLVRNEKPCGNTSIYEFDALNRLIRSVNPLGLTTSYLYDPLGNVVGVLKENGRRFFYYYDALGRLLKEVDLVGREYSYEYDSAGNQIARWNPLGVRAEYAYDLNNRLIKIFHPEKGSHYFEYDAYGNPIESIDMQGRKRSFTYDANNLLIKVNDYDGNEREFSRDQRGNIVEIVFSADKKIRFFYDNLNRIIKKHGSITRAENYVYDAESNLVSIIDNKERQITYSFDYLNRLTAIRYPDGTESSFSYDASGNLVRWKNQHTEVSAEYGPMATLHSIKYSMPRINLAMRYNENWNLKSIDLPDGQSILYAYDNLQRLKKISLTNGTGVNLIYDELGRISSHEYSNGVSQLIQYSSNGRASSINIEKTQNKSICKVYYKYNQAGDLIEESIDELQFKYFFQKDRLVKADLGKFGDLKFAYDELGNRIEKQLGNKNETYRYNQLRQLIRSGSELFTWDDKGFLIERRKGSSFTKFEYNSAGLLGKASDSSGDTISYTYDALDQLLSKKSNLKNEYFVQIEGILLLALSENAEIKELRVYEDLDRPLFSKIGMDSHFYHQDLMDNVLLVTDENGTKHKQKIYSPFGEILSGQSRSCSLGYGARPFDSSFGLYNMRFRNYIPDKGIFLTPDPIINASPYVFASNNPLKFRDPFGLQSIERFYDASVYCAIELHNLNMLRHFRGSVLKHQDEIQKLDRIRKRREKLEEVVGGYLSMGQYALETAIIQIFSAGFGESKPRDLSQAQLHLYWDRVSRYMYPIIIGSIAGGGIGNFLGESFLRALEGSIIGGTITSLIFPEGFWEWYDKELWGECVSVQEAQEELDKWEEKFLKKISLLNKEEMKLKIRGRLRKKWHEQYLVPLDIDVYNKQSQEAENRLLKCLDKYNCIPSKDSSTVNW